MLVEDLDCSLNCFQDCMMGRIRKRRLMSMQRRNIMIRCTIFDGCRFDGGVCTVDISGVVGVTGYLTADVVVFVVSVIVLLIESVGDSFMDVVHV